jgi:hypothetical protein
VSAVFLRESRVSSVEAVFGQLLKVSVPAYQSAEGVKTPWVGSWQGSGTSCPVWARFLATEWRRDLVVLRAMECRKAQEGFSVNRCNVFGQTGLVRISLDHREIGRSFRVNALKGAGSL